MELTLIESFRHSVRKFPDRPMLYEKRDTEYRPTSYRAGFEIVAETAAGLMDLGFNLGDRCLLFSEGRSDWMLSELGIYYAGGIAVPLSEHCDDLTEIRYRSSHTGVRFAIVSENLLPKLLAVKPNLPKLKTIIVLNETRAYDPDLVTMAALRKNGKLFLKKYPDQFEQRWQSVQPQAPASISYSSGTTHRAHGVVLSHQNYLANIEQIKEEYPFTTQTIVGLLPGWNSALVHACGLHATVASGASFAGLNCEADTFLDDVRNLSPHVLITSPAELLKLKQLVDEKVRSKGPAWQKRFYQALQTVSSYQGDGFYDDKWHGQLILKSLIPLFEKLIFSPIHNLFGRRLQFIICGGAHLDVSVQKFFTAIGIPVYASYGLTEASALVSASTPQCLKFGSVGQLVPNLNVKICKQGETITRHNEAGEIHIKGRNVAEGVWDNQKVIYSLLRDQWLCTGDIGYLDEDNHLYILGRTANLLYSETGDQYSPEYLEGLLEASCPFIRYALLYNQRSPYTTALIVPDTDQIFDWLQVHQLDHQTREGQEAVLRELSHSVQQAIVHKSTEKVPDQWVPKTWALIGESFTHENGFLNPDCKVVRSRVFEEYIDRIETLYTPEGQDPVAGLNQTIVQRMRHTAIPE